MADACFTPQVEWILRRCTGRDQTMLFSATLDGDVGHLIRHYLRDPVEVATDAATDTVGTMHHLFLAVHHMDKHRVVGGDRPGRAEAGGVLPDQAAVRQGRHARSVELGVDAAAIHGDLPQVVAGAGAAPVRRGQAWPCSSPPTSPRAGSTSTTSAPSIHYDPPKDAKDYLHRSGRTARAGRDGWAVTLVEYNQHTQMRILQRTLRLPLDAADRGLQQRRPVARPGRRSLADAERMTGRRGTVRGCPGIAAGGPASALSRRADRRRARSLGGCGGDDDVGDDTLVPARRDVRAASGAERGADRRHRRSSAADDASTRRWPAPASSASTCGCRRPVWTRRSASTGPPVRADAPRSGAASTRRAPTLDGGDRAVRSRWSTCAGSAPESRLVSAAIRVDGEADRPARTTATRRRQRRRPGDDALHGHDPCSPRTPCRAPSRSPMPPAPRRTAASCARPQPPATTTTVPPAGGGEDVPDSVPATTG